MLMAVKQTYNWWIRCFSAYTCSKQITHQHQMITSQNSNQIPHYLLLLLPRGERQKHKYVYSWIQLLSFHNMASNYNTWPPSKVSLKYSRLKNISSRNNIPQDRSRSNRDTSALTFWYSIQSQTYEQNPKHNYSQRCPSSLAATSRCSGKMYEINFWELRIIFSKSPFSHPLLYFCFTMCS